MAIDLIVHRRRLPFNKLGKYVEALQHIDIIMRSSHTEKSMPNPQFFMCHCL
jgi:hypothetical protein